MFVFKEFSLYIVILFLNVPIIFFNPFAPILNKSSLF